MRGYQAVVVTAALGVAVAGCGSVPNGAGSSAGASSSASPAASIGASSPTATPRPSPVTRTSPAAKPTAKPAAKPTPHGTTYVIKAGDTLYAIAVRFKVTLAALLAANPGITNSNQVTIGQKILIPTR